MRNRMTLEDQIKEVACNDDKTDLTNFKLLGLIA